MCMCRDGPLETVGRTKDALRSLTFALSGQRLRSDSPRWFEPRALSLSPSLAVMLIEAYVAFRLVRANLTSPPSHASLPRRSRVAVQGGWTPRQHVSRS